MIVIKLGGSAYQHPCLPTWLTQLQHLSLTVPIILVPGGGPFADAVRQAQSDLRFDDPTAHRMAIIAMRQFGLALLNLSPRSRPFQLSDPMPTTLSIWLPDDTISDNGLPQSWDVSADSLALWLAQTIQAHQLYLIKHTDDILPYQPKMQNHLLDAHFRQLFLQQPIPTCLLPLAQPCTTTFIRFRYEQSLT